MIEPIRTIAIHSGTNAPLCVLPRPTSIAPACLRALRVPSDPRGRARRRTLHQDASGAWWLEIPADTARAVRLKHTGRPSAALASEVAARLAQDTIPAAAPNPFAGEG